VAETADAEVLIEKRLNFLDKDTLSVADMREPREDCRVIEDLLMMVSMAVVRIPGHTGASRSM
jgi:hypothetical protein